MDYPIHSLPAVENWSKNFIDSSLPDGNLEKIDEFSTQKKNRANFLDEKEKDFEISEENLDFSTEKRKEFFSPERKKSKKSNLNFDSNSIQPTPENFGFLSDFFAKL